MTFADTTYPCRIGKKGVIGASQGREGDQKTPLGTYHTRFGLYRADRLPRPNSPLRFHSIRQNDGWCDAPNDPAYNRFVRLPYPESHENLWREDGAYDVIIVMSHNASPPVKGLGSAVFIHAAQPDDRKTMGCVAIDPEVISRLLPILRPDMPVIIK